MNGLPPFISFGQAHVGAMISVVLAVIAVPLLVRLLNHHTKRNIGMTIAAILFLNEICIYFISVYVYDNLPGASLPLQLCGVAALLTAWMLWTQSYRAYEIAWFWAMGGSIPAMLTPDLAAGYPHPTFIHFFAGHGLIMLGVLHATFVDGYRPELRSVGKAILATLLLMLVIAPINLLLDTNYMYLCAKPAQTTLIDFLGPWPWYVVSLVIIGAAVCLICYLPFALAEKLSPRSGSEQIKL